MTLCLLATRKVPGLCRRAQKHIGSRNGRRGKADLGGDAEKTIAVHGERFNTVDQRFGDFGERFGDFGERFGDFGKRIDDVVNRMNSYERTSMAFLGLGVGLVYYTGSKIDKQDQKMDERGEKMDEKMDKLDEKMNEKMDKLDEKMNEKMDKLDEKMNEIKISISKLAAGNDQANE